MPLMTENKILDMSEIAGQEHVKRALEVASVAGANVLLIGPPGSGKTMFSDIYGTLLTDNNPHGLIGVSISATVKDIKQIWEDNDGQDTLIIADEFPELKRNVLYYIKELSHDYNIPVIANMHPCPCGYYGDTRHQCTCTPAQIMKYRTKISGSILEMFDIHIETTALSGRGIRELAGTKIRSETTEQVLERIIPARERYRLNGQNLKMDESARDLLETACQRLGFSAKAVSKIIRISRVIADLDNLEDIKTHHIAEAIQYRTLDRSI